MQKSIIKIDFNSHLRHLLKIGKCCQIYCVLIWNFWHHNAHINTASHRDSQRREKHIIWNKIWSLNINSVLDYDLGCNASLQNIYITATGVRGRTHEYGFTFYDQRKRHFDGKGISGGNLTLLAPNKLKWEIDEEAGIWFEIEGCEDCPEVSPIGFSVPNNVVLTKVLQ